MSNDKQTLIMFSSEQKLKNVKINSNIPVNNSFDEKKARRALSEVRPNE